MEAIQTLRSGVPAQRAHHFLQSVLLIQSSELDSRAYANSSVSSCSSSLANCFTNLAMSWQQKLM